ncbi:MAG: 2-octaprenyl-6-methoxyphenyl hydroxylase [Methylococcales bacterium]|nr:2-octaprenyl-6-methoxyphenyl hydroxylase [Methylococcales bacterium]
MQHDYDLLIGGGGLAGNCLALSLKNSGITIALIEAVTRQQLHDSPAGDRALALSAGSVIMLKKLGVWDRVKSKATPIKKIHISDKGHFGKTRLSAEKQGVDALGYVIAARDLETPIAEMVKESGIEQYCPARIEHLEFHDKSVHVSLQGDALGKKIVSAKLLVGADGGQSTVRELLGIKQRKTDYKQTALITTVKSTLPHNNMAYERFTASGPLALLPIDRYHSAVVWTRRHDEAENLLSSSEADFTQHLQACFGYRLGELTLASKRLAFPLTLIRAEKMYAQRSVIIGNAVHQLHPVAGQGFNLGLRDVIQLSDRLIYQYKKDEDLGDASFLHDYAETRQQDHTKVIGFTNSVVKLFSNEWLPIAAIRNSGLVLLDHIPVVKTLLTKQAMGMG